MNHSTHKSSLLILILFVLQGTFAGYAQQNVTFPVIRGVHTFKWVLIEKKVLRATVTKFIKSHPDNFGAYRTPNMYSRTLDDLYPCLHFIDMNNDGLDDVFYAGRSTGEGNEVEIFVNNGKGYKQVFEDLQGVVQIDWDKNKISRLYIENWGCCDEYRTFNKIYAVVFDKNKMPAFKQIYQGVVLESTPEPDSLFDKQFRFEVLNDNYKLRSAPVIDDSTFERWNTDPVAEVRRIGYGNFIALMPAKAKGTAVGWKKDNTGRVWWYVEIDAECTLRKNGHNFNDNSIATKSIGWVSSRFLRKL